MWTLGQNNVSPGALLGQAQDFDVSREDDNKDLRVVVPDLFEHLLPRGIIHSEDGYHQVKCLGSQLIQPFLYAGGQGHLVPMAFQRRPPGHHSERVIDEENPQTFGPHLEVIA